MEKIAASMITSVSASTGRLGAEFSPSRELSPDGASDDAIEQRPVYVDGDAIKMNENLMREGYPYAFVYKGGNYMAVRKHGKTQLFEIRG